MDGAYLRSVSIFLRYLALSININFNNYLIFKTFFLHTPKCVYHRTDTLYHATAKSIPSEAYWLSVCRKLRPRPWITFLFPKKFILRNTSCDWQIVSPHHHQMQQPLLALINLNAHNVKQTTNKIADRWTSSTALHFAEARFKYEPKCAVIVAVGES